MRRRLLLWLGLLLPCSQATPAHAFLNPYVRVGFGWNEQQMNEINDAIAADVGPATAAGVPVRAKKVGPGFGPDLSAGLWLLPNLRVGATYSQGRARVDHEYSEPGFTFVDDFTFRMREAGVEAALRFPALGGLTIGGGAAQGRAEADQDFVLDNIHGTYLQGFTSRRDCRTYSAFASIDQTSANGVAGFIRLGYHWRNVGSMPGTIQIDDNGTTSTVAGGTVPADYSGWSIKLGCGYDLKW